MRLSPDTEVINQEPQLVASGPRGFCRIVERSAEEVTRRTITNSAASVAERVEALALLGIPRRAVVGRGVDPG